jgi:TPP-dependent pyruvate/acetoin dehydrogenase alpha subunit
VVFVCRNNQYAISVPLRLQTASETIAIKAQAYGFEGIRVDGSDVLALQAVTRQGLELARQGGGPTLIEAVCYRLGAHSTSDDPRMYREEREVDEWRSRDCVSRFRLYLEGLDLWNEESEAAMQQEFKSEISQAVEEAESAGDPDIQSLFEDVYAEMTWNLREQRDALFAHLKTQGKEE